LKKSHAGVFWHGWRELLSVPHGPGRESVSPRLNFSLLETSSIIAVWNSRQKSTVGRI
jgi:hypothetical protein